MLFARTNTTWYKNIYDFAFQHITRVYKVEHIPFLFLLVYLPTAGLIRTVGQELLGGGFLVFTSSTKATPVIRSNTEVRVIHRPAVQRKDRQLYES